MISTFAVAMPIVSAQITPTIDGVINDGEWGEPFGTYELTHGTAFTANLYITNDEEYLYVAAQYVDGDFSGSQGMGLATGLNVHIDSDNNDGMPDNSDITIIVSDDGLCIPFVPPQQGWDCGTYYTYTASGAGIIIAVDGDAYSGNGQVEVAVPLSLIDVVPGDTIGLLFQPFSNIKVPPSSPDAAHPDWPETYTDFTLWAPPPPQLYWFMASGGGVSTSDVSPTSGNFITLGGMGISLAPASYDEELVLCKGSGTLVDHTEKIKLSFDIVEGRIKRSGGMIWFYGTAKIFDIENHVKYNNIEFRLALTDGPNVADNRFDVETYGDFQMHWHGTFLPGSESTIWVWE